MTVCWDMAEFGAMALPGMGEVFYTVTLPAVTQPYSTIPYFFGPELLADSQL